jgi:hypothetical protein
VTALAVDLAAALDPVRFAEAAGFPELDPWQRQALRSTSRRQLFNCCRQSGKSTVAAIAAVHAAAYEPGALVLMLAPALRQSQELFRRGYSGVRLLVVDEASRVSDGLYMSIRPMLAVSGGRLLALSTPFGTRGWWHEAWRSEEPWERFEVPATDCPRISPEFLEEERRSMGDWWYRQEYLCAFMDARDAVFRQADIAAAITPDVAPLFGSEVA